MVINGRQLVDSLQSMGFKHVYSVAGGYSAWQAAGYKCTN